MENRSTVLEDDEIIKQADDVAAQITKVLVDAFKAKEGRDPTPEEVEQLIEEVTVERIEELLSGKDHSNSVEPIENEAEEGSADEEELNSQNDENDDENDNAEVDGGSIPSSFSAFMQKTASLKQSSPVAVADVIDEGSAKKRRLEAPIDN